MSKINIKNKKTKKGFSIGEVMLAVFILGTTLTALISLYATGIKHLTDERDNMIASLLAQEGVELARNIRDNNWAADRISFTGIIQRDNCPLDYTSTSCGASSTMILNYGNGYYRHSGGTSTKFRRRIRIQGTGETRVVTSSVTWNSVNPVLDYTNCNTGNKCVFSQSTLTKWGE